MKASQIGISTLLILAIVALLVVWLNTTDTKTALIVLGLILVLFYKLDVQVTDQDVTLKFGIGLIRRKIPLDQITNAKAVKNSVWSGWGIRVGPSFTLYNVSGFSAIELTLRGKKRKVRIGTTVPEKLSQYINQKVIS
ncbi:hypothetical protein [Spirosoma pollinicola]|uniref:DUF304 domain-containing protein n=1 Tax=Spirosoma pollinicola TaxID=2057025 RepID=A0A2K8Z3H6_9BACT|nr:hypothetical protein [Spirosoma pollinicola]AUD04418.1 hypothetical protein CWM47_22775 [Spirosoma pollinicola]